MHPQPVPHSKQPYLHGLHRQAAVQSKTSKRGQGNRGQELAPFVFPQAAADAIARGDMDAAGAAFEVGLINQYGAPGLEIADFKRLDMTF